MIPLRDDIRSSRRPVATYALIAACAGVWLLQFTGARGSAGAFNRGLELYGMTPVHILAGRDLWTLLSSLFMHGGWFHFLGNMLYLWIFGDNVEDALRPFWFLFVYILSGLTGNLLHIGVSLLTGGPLDIPTIGASGAISGVMGAYLVLFPRARVLTLVPLFIFMRMFYLPASVLLGFWILLQILNGCGSVRFAGGGVAYFAHIGGFLVGLIAGLLARPRTRRPWYEIR